jgi:hypothetical protein
LSVEVGVTSIEAYGCGYVTFTVKVCWTVKITKTSCD